MTETVSNYSLGSSVEEIARHCLHGFTNRDTRSKLTSISSKQGSAAHNDRAMPTTAKNTTLERWALDAGDAATATLTIPADAKRERRFEIACAITVGVPDPAGTSWLQMTVQANGTQQWRRRGPAHNPGAWDGLDYRFSRSVPVGQALRITVTAAGQGVRRQRLVIEAD